MNDYSSYQEQPGLFSPVNIALMGGVAARHTVGLTNEFYGDVPFGGRRKAARSIARYASGRPLDYQTARRLAGRSWASKRYASLVDKFPSLGRLAPNLSYLGPSRYVALAAAMSGHAGAGAGVAAMNAVDDAVFYAKQAGINAFSRAGGAEVFGDMGAKAMGGANFFDRPVSVNEGIRRAGMGTWGDYTKAGSATRQTIAEQAARIGRAGMSGASEAEKTAGRIAVNHMVRDAGVIPGSGLEKFGHWFGKGVMSGGAKGAMFKGTALALPSVARMGATFAVGIDLYTAGMLLGNLMGKATIGAMNAPVKAYNMMTQDLNRGLFMSSSPLSSNVGATGRQRAMANIYDRQLNLRQVLGNEASFLARL